MSNATLKADSEAPTFRGRMPAPPDVRQRVAQLVEAKGAVQAAVILGVSRGTVLGIMSSTPVLGSTLTQVSARLP